MAAATKKKAAVPKRKVAAESVTSGEGEAALAPDGDAKAAKPKAAKPKSVSKAVAKPESASVPKASAKSKPAAAPKAAAKPKAAAAKARVSSKVVEPDAGNAESLEATSPGIADTLVAEMIAQAGPEPVAEPDVPPVEPVVAKAKRAASRKKATATAPALAESPVPDGDAAIVIPLFPDTRYSVVEKLLVGFVASEVRKVGLTRVVLGLSGGVDSAVSAAIAARALGPSNVLGIFMPYQSSSPESRADADAVAAALGIETMVVDITAQVDSYFERFEDASRLRRGNKMARERMTILYDHSAARSALVIGTSNKTELLLGYGTLYGDMASALNPIGDLYKTQVWGLARHLGLPASVIEKAPTADLWSGQTDENELGFSYHQVDQLLYRMIDERCSTAELEDMGFESAFVERISRMIRSSQFKRRLPVIAKLSTRSIDTDFRYSRDWGL